MSQIISLNQSTKEYKEIQNQSNKKKNHYLNDLQEKVLNKLRTDGESNLRINSNGNYIYDPGSDPTLVKNRLDYIDTKTNEKYENKAVKVNEQQMDQLKEDLKFTQRCQLEINDFFKGTNDQNCLSKFKNNTNFTGSLNTLNGMKQVSSRKDSRMSKFFTLKFQINSQSI